MDATTIELPEPLIDSIDVKLGRYGRAIVAAANLALFRQTGWSRGVCPITPQVSGSLAPRLDHSRHP